MRRFIVPLAMLMLLAGPSSANAARRYATLAGSTISPDCAVTDPCRIDRAVNRAGDGDEVIVGPGNYKLDAVLKPDAEIDLHGDVDHAWPKIVAPASLGGPLLTFKAGTLSHLSLNTSVKDHEALVMNGGVADGIELDAAYGTAGTIVASNAGTVLRNSVARTTDSRGKSFALALAKHGGSAHAELRNVTAMAVAGSATGIRCDADGPASLVNVLVRGKAADITASGPCTAAFSNFRPDFSSGVAPGTGNQSGEPIFADGDYRPAAGSPTIDAGALDALASSPDPDGRPRTLGAAPDIGAYEYAPPPPGKSSPTLPESLQGVPLPTQGVSVIVAPARGVVRVRRPGEDRFAALDEAGRVPVGSILDTRHGRVQLASALADGRVQTGLFWGSAFKTGQRRNGGGMTTLTLRGGAVCRTRAGLAVASRKHKRRHKRRLWARDDGGRFRTHGNDSVATARGTAWLTRDRCAGTLTRVKEGAVSVHDLRRHKRVLVKAGHSYLARARR
jgi:hypothetical protein